MTRIAVLLTEPYRGGTLRVLKHEALMLKLGAEQRGVDLDVVVGVREDSYDLDRDLGILRENGIPVRELYLKGVPGAQAEQIMRLNDRRIAAAPEHDYYFLASDRCNDFLDCDFWFFETDRCPFPVLPVRPYGMHVADYIQRYYPPAFPDGTWEVQTRGFIPSVREASFLVTTTPAVTTDLSSYAGVPPERVFQIPVFIECDFNPSDQRLLEGDYFVWLTNTTPHKNHERVLAALQKYYTELGGKLKVMMVGPLTKAFSPRNNDPQWNAWPYVLKVRETIRDDLILRKNVFVAGELPDPLYAGAIKNSRFLLNANLYDNGCLSTIDAAYLGVPSVTGRYPAQEYFDEAFRLNSIMFDPFSVDELAVALKTMEQRCGDIRLPERSFLDCFDWRRVAPQFFDIVYSHMNGEVAHV
jgi:glycosyltransferase involved in cell wall biosynthesis